MRALHRSCREFANRDPFTTAHVFVLLVLGLLNIPVFLTNTITRHFRPIVEYVTPPSYRSFAAGIVVAYCVSKGLARGGRLDHGLRSGLLLAAFGLHAIVLGDFAVLSFGIEGGLSRYWLMGLGPTQDFTVGFLRVGGLVAYSVGLFFVLACCARYWRSGPRA